VGLHKWRATGVAGPGSNTYTGRGNIQISQYMCHEERVLAGGDRGLYHGLQHRGVGSGPGREALSAGRQLRGIVYVQSGLGGVQSKLHKLLMPAGEGLLIDLVKGWVAGCIARNCVSCV
jgi:hypothetical protein